MQIPVEEIKVNKGRRKLDGNHVEELAESIRELGLLNPLTVDRGNALIAGLHRLEAVRRLGWTEVECTVSSLEGLQAELAEIDENIVRSDLPALEYGEILLRRKEIYEALHPEARHGGDRKSGEIKRTKCPLDPAKSFVDDTADKLGIDPRTVRRQIQTARDLTPETKDIIRGSDAKITKKTALGLSRLEPERQKAAAELLAAGEIRTVEEYTARTEGRRPAENGQEDVMQAGREPEIGGGATVAGSGGQEMADTVSRNAAGMEQGGRVEQRGLSTGEMDPPTSFILNVPPECAPQERQGTSIRDLVAELKDPDKDCSGTPESFLEEYAAFVRKFHREIEWYNDPYYDTVYPCLDRGQLASLREMTQAICSAAEGILKKAERMMER